MYHEVHIIGYLGGDPEFRYTPTGKEICSFSVATNRKWNDSNGESQEKTVWFRAQAWGNMANICNKYLTKSRQVFIKGELNPDSNGSPRIWVGKDGVQRTSYEIRVSQIKFLGKKVSGASDAQDGLTEDEIPFGG